MCAGLKVVVRCCLPNLSFNGTLAAGSDIGQGIVFVDDGAGLEWMVSAADSGWWVELPSGGVLVGNQVEWSDDLRPLVVSGMGMA